MRLSIITLTVVACSAIAWIASAGIVQTHYGDTVPTDEGWTKNGHPANGTTWLNQAVPSDTGYGDLPAWKIADLSGGMSATYSKSLGSTALGEAASQGWKLTAKLRVDGAGYNSSGNVTSHPMFVEFGGSGASNFNGRWGMRFGSDDSGNNALINMWNTTGTFTVAGGGYHQYDLIDPTGSGSAALYVDGQQVATGIGMTDGSLTSRVIFGDAHTTPKGNANYNYVALETGAGLQPTPSPGYSTMRGAGVLYTFEQDLGSLITDKLTRDGAQDPIVYNDVYVDSSTAAFGNNSGRFDLPVSGRSYLEIVDSKELGSAFTLAAMINVDSGELSPTRLFASYVSSSIASDELIFDVYGTLRFMQNETAVTTSIPSSLQQPGWHHVASTYDGGAVVLYVDGVAVGSGTLAGNSVTLAKNLLFGEDYNTINEQLVGGADDILLVRRALTQPEIQFLWEHGAESAGFLIPEPSTLLLLLIGLMALATRRRK